MLLYFLSDIFHQFSIILNIFQLLLFILSDLFHHISCDRHYLSDLFCHIFCEYFLYQSGKSFFQISILLYHQLIFLHSFHLFLSITHCFIFVMCHFSLLSPWLSSLISHIQFFRCCSCSCLSLI